MNENANGKISIKGLHVLVSFVETPQFVFSCLVLIWPLYYECFWFCLWSSELWTFVFCLSLSHSLATIKHNLFGRFKPAFESTFFPFLCGSIWETLQMMTQVYEEPLFAFLAANMVKRMVIWFLSGHALGFFILILLEKLTRHTQKNNNLEALHSPFHCCGVLPKICFSVCSACI